jgi:transcription initiation factor TFIID subunit 13
MEDSSSKETILNDPLIENLEEQKFDEEEQEFDEEEEEEEKFSVHFLPAEINNKRKKLLTRDLRPMMYGFGDEPQTLSSTLDLMEEMVLEYIVEITQKAGELGRRRGKFRTEDLIFLVRKDPKRYARIEELLYMNEELKRARRAFDIGDYEKMAVEKRKMEEKKKGLDEDEKD